MIVKGQKNHYNVKLLRGYGVSINLENNKVVLKGRRDVLPGQQIKNAYVVAHSLSPRLFARAALCMLALIVLALPSVAVSSTNAQGTDTSLPQTHVFVSFENYDREAGKVTYQTIDGTVQFTSQYGTILMNGEGTGTLRWDLSGAYCPDVGDLTFPATITGSAQESVGENGAKVLVVSLQVFVGESLNDSTRYAKEYSVQCYDPPRNERWTENRTIGPVPLLTQIRLKQNATNWDGQEGTGMDTIGSIIKVKLSPPDFDEVIEVRADKDVLNPTDANPKTVVTVTAMTVGGVKLKQMPIKIKVCTEIGSKNTDGHIHDSRSDKCDRGNRPQAILKYQGVTYHGTFDGMTNDAGQIVFDYEPAFSYRVFKDKSTGAITGISSTQKLYIAGKDDIIATKVSDERVKGETSITTKVQGLQPMAYSENCAGNTNYYFVQQGKHGCIFYSTLATNDAMARISKAFVDKQIDCKNQPGGKCYLIDKSGNNVTFTIVSDVKRVRITAMSLPWGGLHDIAGDLKNPHITHSGGKAVDIGLTGLGATEKDRRLMLWHLISLDPNFSNFEVGEGRVFDLTANHFHANFRS